MADRGSSEPSSRLDGARSAVPHETGDASVTCGDAIAALARWCDQLSDGLAVVEADRIVAANTTLCQLLDRQPAELHGCLLSDHFPRTASNESRRDGADDGQPLTATVCAKDGTQRYVDLHHRVVELAGRSMNVMVVRENRFFDTEAAKRSYYAMALTYAERMDRLLHITGKMIESLNEPLGAIANYAHACRRIADGSGSAGDVIELQNAVVEQVDRAGRLLRGIRDLVRGDPETDSFVDLNRVLESVLNLMQGVETAGGLRFALRLHPDLSSLAADAFHVEHVLLVLLHHAIGTAQASSASGRVLTVTTVQPYSTTVELRLEHAGVCEPLACAQHAPDDSLPYASQNLARTRDLLLRVLHLHHRHFHLHIDEKGDTIYTLRFVAHPHH